MTTIFDIVFDERDLGPFVLSQTSCATYLLVRGHVMTKYSEEAPEEGSEPNDVRPLIDETDRRILKILAVEARIPNNALAERVGIAPSTCMSRVRSLVQNGVIRGFYADIDPEAVGTPFRRSSSSACRSMPATSSTPSRSGWRP
jgi:hypothetical protein